MRTKYKYQNELSGIKKEYVDLGVELGFFNDGNIFSVCRRLQDIRMVEDYGLKGDARTSFESGRTTLIINPARCEGHGEHYMDEVIFHEFSHFINEIHRDLYVYSSKTIVNFKERYSEYAEGNNLVRYPEWGMILLDECISQYIAQRMVSQKYGEEIYKGELFISSLTEPGIVLKTELADYKEAYKFADKFSKTIFSGEDSMDEMCKAAINHNLLDNIVYRYSIREDGLKELYEILGYMGNVMIAYYSKHDFYKFNGSEENKDPKNVLKSMKLVLDKTEELGREE